MVTSDGSWRSLQALPHAARLAKATAGELVLARVLDPMTDCRGEGERPSPESAERLAATWRDDMKGTLRAFQITGRAVVGTRGYADDITSAILKTAADEQADILAMSSRGAGLLRHAFMGSVALGVLSRSDLPVLVAGDRVSYPPADGDYHILAPTDGSEDSLQAVRLAASLATHEGVRVTLARVYASALGDRGLEHEVAAAGEQLRELRSEFPNPGATQCLVRAVVTLGGIDTAILGAAQEVGANVVVLSTHGHSARYHLFAGSTALALLKRSPLPILLVRPQAARGTTAL